MAFYCDTWRNQADNPCVNRWLTGKVKRRGGQIKIDIHCRYSGAVIEPRSPEHLLTGELFQNINQLHGDSVKTLARYN